MTAATDATPLGDPQAGCKRRTNAGTINVRLDPFATPEAARAALSRLIEEWAALTYACMVESALAAAQPANEPMLPSDEPVFVAPTGAVRGA